MVELEYFRSCADRCKASSNYQKSIHALRLALRDMDQGHLDAYLLTIFFLARYEDSVQGPPPATEQAKAQIPGSRAHIHGIAAGLKYWSQSPGSKPTATCVIKWQHRSRFGGDTTQARRSAPSNVINTIGWS